MRVVAGSPTAEELAAVIAVLQATAADVEQAGRVAVADAPRSSWDGSTRTIRRPLPRGDGGWARSLR